MADHSRNEQARIRVLVVDDQRLMRDGIASLLSLQPGIEVVGTAANGQDATEQAVTLLPDVVLMDIRMPVMNGVEATAEVRRLTGCKVLMLTTFDDEEYVADALKAGASGYLLKDIPAADLAQAVRAVHRGIYQLDPSVANRMFAALGGQIDAPNSQPAASAQSNRFATLTHRETAVLRLIARGATNREIAEELVISEGTVKTHISSILSRLGLRDRTQAALYAREAGLV